jgi:hypothetical protein
MRFAAVFGALGGWLLGYLFNEYVSRSRAHQASWCPEDRLFGVFVPATFECAGLILFGLGNQFKLSWVALDFSWFMVNTGLVGTMVAITAFVLEKYPSHATTVSAILSMWRSCGTYFRGLKPLRKLANANIKLGGFSVSHYQADWVARNRVGVIFGIQASIVAFFVCTMIIPVISFAKSTASSPRWPRNLNSKDDSI